MARLLYRDGQGREGTVDLIPTEVLYVGRGLECAIRSDDGMVSRRHSQVKMENGRFVVEDLGSANGVFLNNQRVQKHALDHTDVFQCGSLLIRFLDETAASAPPPKAGSTMLLDRSDHTDVTDRSDPDELDERPGPPPPPRALPFGGPPPMPGMPTETATPALPYGGPPPLPGESNHRSSRPTRPVGPTATTTPPPIAAMVAAAERTGPRDPGDQETGALAAKLAAARIELDDLGDRYEREVADHKRARADLATERDRMEELLGELAERDEHTRAEVGVADELRDELAGARADLEQLRGEHEQLAEAVAARELTAARADDEVTRLREMIAERDRRLVELTRGRDDVRTQINAQMAELDRLRSVIDEQEQMLEERRVSLVTRDEVIVKLRTARSDTAVLDAARDIHDVLNDRLSELRNHGEVVRHEAPALAGEPARVQAVQEAATALVEVADAAKRDLRRLRELADATPRK